MKLAILCIIITSFGANAIPVEKVLKKFKHAGSHLEKPTIGKPDIIENNSGTEAPNTKNQQLAKNESIYDNLENKTKEKHDSNVQKGSVKVTVTEKETNAYKTAISSAPQDPMKFVNFDKNNHISIGHNSTEKTKTNLIQNKLNEDVTYDSNRQMQAKPIEQSIYGIPFDKMEQFVDIGINNSLTNNTNKSSDKILLKSDANSDGYVNSHIIGKNANVREVREELLVHLVEFLKNLVKNSSIAHSDENNTEADFEDMLKSYYIQNHVPVNNKHVNSDNDSHMKIKILHENTSALNAKSSKEKISNSNHTENVISVLNMVLHSQHDLKNNTQNNEHKHETIDKKEETKYLEMKSSKENYTQAAGITNIVNIVRKEVTLSGRRIPKSKTTIDQNYYKNIANPKSATVNSSNEVTSFLIVFPKDDITDILLTQSISIKNDTLSYSNENTAENPNEIIFESDEINGNHIFHPDKGISAKITTQERENFKTNGKYENVQNNDDDDNLYYDEEYGLETVGALLLNTTLGNHYFTPRDDAQLFKTSKVIGTLNLIYLKTKASTYNYKVLKYPEFYGDTSKQTYEENVMSEIEMQNEGYLKNTISTKMKNSRHQIKSKLRKTKKNNKLRTKYLNSNEELLSNDGYKSTKLNKQLYNILSEEKPNKKMKGSNNNKPNKSNPKNKVKSKPKKEPNFKELLRKLNDRIDKISIKLNNNCHKKNGPKDDTNESDLRKNDDESLNNEPESMGTTLPINNHHKIRKRKKQKRLTNKCKKHKKNYNKSIELVLQKKNLTEKKHTKKSTGRNKEHDYNITKSESNEHNYSNDNKSIKIIDNKRPKNDRNVNEAVRKIYDSDLIDEISEKLSRKLSKILVPKNNTPSVKYTVTTTESVERIELHLDDY